MQIPPKCNYEKLSDIQGKAVEENFERHCLDDLLDDMPEQYIC